VVVAGIRHPVATYLTTAPSVQAALAVLAALILFGASYVLMRPVLVRLLARTGPDRIPWIEEDPPAHWGNLVRDLFPASRRLSSTEFDRLLRIVQIFLRDTRFEGAGGFVVTEPVRLSVASQACYLVLGKETNPFPSTRRIIVYPETFVPRRPASNLDFDLVDMDEGPTLGESWDHGTVILSWPSVTAGAKNPDDGWNVVFHEFAHQLDQGDGESGGMPADVPVALRAEWQALVAERLEELRADLDDGVEPYLDDYAATNEAEFFAVAVEAYFEVPTALAEVDPELFELFLAYFGWAPDGAGGTSRRELTRGPEGRA